MYRRPLHALVGIAFWLLFALLWADLVRDGAVTAASVTHVLLVVGLLAALVLGVSAAWVRHNVRIHRRLGPRPGTPILAPRTDVDRLGRTLRWDLAGGHLGAIAARHLVVDLDRDAQVKQYRPTGGERP